jgi:hypothetical protein
MFKRLCALAAGAALMGLVIGSGHTDLGTLLAGGRVDPGGAVLMAGGHIDPNGAVASPMGGGHIDPNGGIVSVAAAPGFNAR